MHTFGLRSRFFATGALLGALFTLLAYVFAAAPASAPVPVVAQEAVINYRGCNFADVIEFDGVSYPMVPGVARPGLPPREQLSLPIFPGCEGEADYEERVMCGFGRLVKFIESNRQTPAGSARERVIVRITIDKVTGLTRDPEVVKYRDERNRDEALRIVRLLQEREVRWVPGTRDGRAVDMTLGLPVSFHGARCGE